jgi:hypothetical protein
MKLNDQTEPHASISIASINIENAKTNKIYLDHLILSTDIVCIQEHWLANYEADTLPDSDQHKAFTKCYDDPSPLPPTHRPRGSAGISIIWKNSIDSAITIIPDGSNRLQVIQIATDQQPVTLINTYMPAEGTLDQSTSYASLLDEVYEITHKYSPHSSIIWTGDLNAALQRGRPTKNDKLFKAFICENNYEQIPGTPTEPTYHHFAGTARSQIDHFLFLTHQEVITDGVQIDARNPINMSSHDSIHSVILRKPLIKPIFQSTTTNSVQHRTNWKKIDIQVYHDISDAKLAVLQDSIDKHLPTEIILDRLHAILRSSAEEASLTTKRSAKTKRKKPDWPPHIKPLIKSTKSAHAMWKAAGTPDCNAPSAKSMKAAKQQLRSAQRQVTAARRNEHLAEMMTFCRENSNQLFTLIKKQRASAGTQACIDFGNMEEMDGWSDYYADLATPKDEPHFNPDFLKSINFKTLLLEEASRTAQPLPTANPAMVKRYIKSLKNNKAPDIYGITSEHLKMASIRVTQILTSIINTISEDGRIPAIHKLGAVTPVLKKGKPAQKPDSYRRITVTPTTGKVVEKHVQYLSKPFYDKAQNRLQRGFTEKASSTNVALIITEAIAEAMDAKQPLYIQFLDAKKAFDVVWHSGMLCSLHDQGITGRLWSLHSDLYKGITSCIKWKGQLSDTFEDKQGLRQGGLTSADSFKTKGNPLLNEVENSPDAFCIGATSVGGPTCADDSALCAKNITAAKSLTAAAAKDSANQRYLFSTTKSRIMIMNPSKTCDSQLKSFPIRILDAPMEESHEEIHLGIHT